MILDYNILNILILFGAIQGFILCFFIYKRDKQHKTATSFFILFLFSLAFYNFIYAFIDMDLFRYYRPLHMFPFPYKWLIGIGFYFYIKNQLKSEQQISIHKKEWYLFLPAIIYGLIRLYWFGIAIKENSFRITQVIMDSNFFRIHEFVYLFFTIIICLKALQFINRQSKTLSKQQQKNIKWLKTFSYVYLTVLIFNLSIYSVDLIIHKGTETFFYLYPTLIANVAFIYWIGYIGFTKPNLIITDIKSPLITSFKNDNLAKKLDYEIETLEVYTNQTLSISELSKKLNVNAKELSNYINDVHNMNFSEYLNYHRVLKTKELIKSPEAKKYTLVTLANKAGFNSKSSFNAAFKKVTGITPSQYRKTFKKE